MVQACLRLGVQPSWKTIEGGPITSFESTTGNNQIEWFIFTAKDKLCKPIAILAQVKLLEPNFLPQGVEEDAKCVIDSK